MRRGHQRAFIASAPLFFLLILGIQLILAARDTTGILHSPSPFIPGALVVWVVHAYIDNFSSATHETTTLPLINLAVFLAILAFTTTYAFYAWILCSNSMDRSKLSQEDGAGRFASFESIPDMFLPEGYDIWSGFSAAETQREEEDLALLADQQRRIRAYSEALYEAEREQGIYERGNAVQAFSIVLPQTFHQPPNETPTAEESDTFDAPF